MKNRGKTFCFLATVLAVALLGPGFGEAQPVGSPASPGDTPRRANIGFGRVMEDAGVIEILQRHSVKPRTVFMTSPGGFSGTHRLYDGQDIQEAVEDARLKTTEMFESSLEGNLVRLRRFAERYTEKDVTADEGLQKRARSLLNLRAALEASLEAALNGDPLIYSVEVTGRPGQIERLRRDKQVRDVRAERQAAGRRVVPRSARPKTDREEYLDPTVQSMNVMELYHRIETLGLTAPEVSTFTDLQGETQ